MQRTTTGWSCLTVATSYEAFIAQASGRAWDPGQKATGSRPDPSALLQASKQLTGAEVSCVSVDMPLATTAITGRRAADTAISSRTPRRHRRSAARRWLPLAHQWQRSGPHVAPALIQRDIAQASTGTLQISAEPEMTPRSRSTASLSLFIPKPSAETTLASAKPLAWSKTDQA